MNQPHNLDAERATLGAILIEPKAADEVLSGLTADDYFLPAHREVYDAIAALENRRHAVDVVSVMDELTTRKMRDPIDLVQLASDVPTADNVSHYIRIVKEKATLRRLISVAQDAANRASTDHGDFETFMDEVESQVFGVTQKTRKQSGETVDGVVSNVLGRIQERAIDRREVTGVPTGFTEFDKLTAGLQPENLIVVAARPGAGKTSWTMNAATNAAIEHQMPVLIFSLEMSRGELVERMLSSEASVDSAKLKRGNIEYGEWQRVLKAGMKLSKAPITIDDNGAPTLLDIRAKARRWKSDARFFPKGNELGLVIVDYLQLMRSGGKNGSREQEIAEISRGLKTLGKELKLPVVAVAQLNRAMDKREDKRPLLSDLRESGAIEQDADMVIFIHRAELYTKNEMDRGRAELIVEKSRHTRTGDVPLKFTREFTRFENPDFSSEGAAE